MPMVVEYGIDPRGFRGVSPGDKRGSRVSIALPGRFGLQAVSGSALLFLRMQRPFVTFHGFAIAFEAIAKAAFVEVGDGHGAIGINGAVVAFQGLLRLPQLFQRRAFFNQRFSVVRGDGQYPVEANNGFFEPVAVEERLGLFQQRCNFRGVVIGLQGVFGLDCVDVCFAIASVQSLEWRGAGVFQLHDSLFESFELAEQPGVGLRGGAISEEISFAKAESGSCWNPWQAARCGQGGRNLREPAESAPLKVSGEDCGAEADGGEEANDHQQQMIRSPGIREFIAALGEQGLLDGLQMV